MLVWPGQMTTVPLEKARLNPTMSASSNPFP
jgi:hypothetical protein